MTNSLHESSPEADAASTPSNFRWLSYFTIPILILGLITLDLSLTLVQYAERVNDITTRIKPGMPPEQVYAALEPGPYVIGYTDDTYYVEVKIRRPLLARAAIAVGQKLGKASQPFRRLLPLEMCLVKRDSFGDVAPGDFLEHWWW